jgi:hypothetical protein
MKFFLENPIFIWVSAFILTLLVFYGMDQFIMLAQGLPLNLDMTPAQ